MEAAGFVFEDGRWRPREGDELGEDWSIVEGFPEVPARLLNPEGWRVCRSGTWGRDEHITLLEARALLASVRRLAQVAVGSDLRHLHLCDNMSVVLAVSRSRCRDFTLLTVLRKLAGFLLARNIMLHVRWVPSELNFAEEPSRIFSEKASSSLAWVIPDVVRARVGGPPRPLQA